MLRFELGDLQSADAADRLRDQRGFAFLDSAEQSRDVGRYSFIGIRPFGSFASRNGIAFWNDAPLPGPPLAELKARLAQCRLDADEASELPFSGAAIGYVSYDFGRRLETLREPLQAASEDEVLLRFYDVVLAFDHHARRARLLSSGLPEPEGPRRRRRAERRAGEVLALLEPRQSEGDRAARSRGAIGPWIAGATPVSYREAVERVRRYILDGDIYQANIAQRFETALPDGFDAWSFYRHLRRLNPAPFGAFLALGDARYIASSSPERFLRCRNGEVEARPIKGTAPRAADPREDAALAAALLASEKDRAENVMIVDLLRNDLSRVCRAGSVEVPVLCGLESYAGLHHLTSVVRARLREGADALDLIRAAFPCGSITGAPKLRAMDIITEIERAGRGVYCGAIGWLGFDGGMDLNVAIRTVTLEPSRASFHAGGGITLLSDPEGEYQETLLKAQRIFRAFEACAAAQASA